MYAHCTRVYEESVIMISNFYTHRMTYCYHESFSAKDDILHTNERLLPRPSSGQQRKLCDFHLSVCYRSVTRTCPESIYSHFLKIRFIVLLTWRQKILCNHTSVFGHRKKAMKDFIGARYFFFLVFVLTLGTWFPFPVLDIVRYVASLPHRANRFLVAFTYQSLKPKTFLL